MARQRKVEGRLLAILLINSGVPYLCFKCKNDKWMGEELRLQVDHIDGNCDNNKLSNLRFLCPNCHSLTKTFYNGPKWFRKCSCGKAICKGSKTCYDCYLKNGIGKKNGV